MKSIKKFEEYNNWVTDVTGNVNVSYGDKKPKLSDVAIEVIKFIEDNFDKIREDLNGTSDTFICFEDGLDFNKISIYKNEKENIPYIHFQKNEVGGYSNDITNYDYDYLHDYLDKIYKTFRKKHDAENKEKFEMELMKKNMKKYNL